ncbi:MAG: hypothetical protein AAGC55_17920, partial [Myxococcota bacterium]
MSIAATATSSLPQSVYIAALGGVTLLFALLVGCAEIPADSERPSQGFMSSIGSDILNNDNTLDSEPAGKP